MNLSETLGYADIAQLHQLARVYELECNRNSKHELIQSLYSRFTSRLFLNELYMALTWAEKRFLLMLVYEKKTQYTQEGLMSKARRACGEDGGYDRLIDRALAAGWLFRMRNVNGIVTYAMPDDLRVCWREIFVKEVQNAAYGYYTTPDEYRDDTFALASDVRTLLTYIQSESIPLSKEGAMYRKHQLKLMELFVVSEPLLVGKEWRFGYGRMFRAYPDRLALLYDYVHYERWVQERDIGLYLTEEGIQRVAQQEWERGEIAERLVHFWILSYKKAIPAMESLWMLIARVCVGSWLEEEKLVQALSNWTHGFYYDTQEVVIRRRMLSMMAYLGLLRTGTLQSGSRVYSITEWGRIILNKNTKL
ncbi:hypothetical protein DFP93_103277 [Aneurinibacillus soli]|uniref:Uncharacterized protein n=1 Tax=Aneurinibacillus soli TaxID=1500254 RepID=A0A0U5BD32_9BACL|nr:hypothetical protein [Aneurinibacillus soli]PYE63065.1 hypothetical protein DFP93_103277 [Aneurinibacillus soli]BAU28876.1 hypothetical protein CB4_03053 [Aneurinibacillus soli]